MPKAAVLLPLPLPVKTSSTPRSVVACAMRASTTAFLRCMRARWRAASAMLAGQLTAHLPQLQTGHQQMDEGGGADV